MQGSTPVPAPPATPEAPTAQVIGQPAPASGVAGATPQAIYEAIKAQRRELTNQLENLEDRRRDLSNRLQENTSGGADRNGLEQHIAEIDTRISTLNTQIAEADAAVARAAGVPGAVVPPKPPQRVGPPDEAWVLGGMFIVVVLLPLSIALARRIWRRGVTAITSLPAELGERLTRLEQGMDAIAVEVERIGEGQRYMARMFAEDGPFRALGAGAAEPVPVKARDAEAELRR